MTAASRLLRRGLSGDLTTCTPFCPSEEDRDPWAQHLTASVTMRHRVLPCGLLPSLADKLQKFRNLLVELSNLALGASRPLASPNVKQTGILGRRVGL